MITDSKVNKTQLLTTARQYAVCVSIALPIYAIERWVDSVYINSFITSQALLLVAALMAIGFTSITFLIARLNDLENNSGKYHFFDESKRVALYCIREQGAMFILIFLTLACSPDACWSVAAPWYQCIVPCIIARACIFQALYATYDFIRATVESSIAQ